MRIGTRKKRGLKEGRGIGIKFGGGPTESEGKQEMQEIQGRAKKNLAKFSNTCYVRADGLCISSPRLVGGRKAGNSNIQEFFCTMLQTEGRGKSSMLGSNGRAGFPGSSDLV